MQHTPNANRMHIAIFGKRNVGKSSLINAITGQSIALVSNIAGTTTDPVYKAMELLPIGPVVMIDTAGIDDEGEIGELRIRKTKEVIDKTDLALLIFSPENEISIEREWYDTLKEANIPIIGVINKSDLAPDFDLDAYKTIFDIPFIMVSAKDFQHMDELKNLIFKLSPVYERDVIVGDIIKPGDTVVLVAPQDIQAPKGRLILPQVQTIRDVLDHKGLALTITDDKLEDLLNKLNQDPDLVITDSQVFNKVNKILKRSVPLTSFSILMARYKGELHTLVQGAQAIENLKDGDKVLIAEACTHHALDGDIGREKLPKWLKSYSNANLDITVKAGLDFESDLSQFSLIVHCGACMFNRKQMMTRIKNAAVQNIPMTNYGTAIAYMNGILERVTEMYSK